MSVLTVTGLYPTTTTLAPTGQTGNFSLTATIASTSQATVPSGTIRFFDETNSGEVLGSAPLATGAAGFTLLPTVVPTITGAVVSTGDFNGDGKIDLVTADNAGNVNVALGNGDGTFTALPGAALLAYTYIESIVTADFNSDGKADLAITGSGNDVTILLGNGDGTFTIAAKPPVGQRPVGIAVGDWNGDGIPDLAVTNDSSNEVSILLGNGDGSFTVGKSVDTTAGPAPVVTGDFNGDGKLDLAVLTYSDYSVTIFLGNGDGTFVKMTSPAYTSFDLSSIAVGDFNGDGHLDIAASEALEGVVILLGHGDGTFTNAGYTATTDPAGIITVGDFNGDGKPDISVADSNGNGTDGPAILLGNGDGTFNVAGPFPGNFSNSLATADFNGDGETDVVFVSGYTSTGVSPLGVLLAQGGITATAIVSHISPVGSSSHLIEATYGGDENFGPSVSPEVGLQAEPLTTQLTLKAVPNTSTYGQQILITATLTPFNGQGITTDSEPVTFSSNGAVLGNGSLSGGVATLNVSSLSAGTDSLTASYNGDTNFLYATSSNLTFNVASATLTVVPVNASRPYGAPNPSLNGLVTGALNGDTFTVVGSSTANPQSPVGTYPITYMVYGYDVSDYTISNATGTLTVTAATPGLSWSAPAPITYGTALSSAQLDATATTPGSFTYSPAPGTVPNAGIQALTTKFTPTDQTDFTTSVANVSLKVNQAPLAVAANSATRIFGTANPAFTGTVTGALNNDTFTESFVTPAGQGSNVGKYAIVASAKGNAINNYAVSATDGTLTITQAGTTTSVGLSNQNLTIIATVVSKTTGTPTGIVGFYQGQTLVGTGTLIEGMAAYTAPALPPGNAQITAQYQGDINFTSSMSTSRQLLTVAPTSSSLAVAETGSVTDALAISALAGYTGTVQFSCSGLPQYATCSFQPASLSFTSVSNSGNVILTVNTGTAASLATPSFIPVQTSRIMIAMAFLWVPGVSFLAFRKRLSGVGTGKLLLLALIALGCGSFGCAGGGSMTTPSNPTPLQTPAGMSTVQVVASGAGGLTETVSLTLTVQ